MRKLRHYQRTGPNVEAVLEDFNRHAEEKGIAEEDVISVSVLPVVPPVNVHDPTVGTSKATFEVVVAYWSST